MFPSLSVFFSMLVAGRPLVDSYVLDLPINASWGEYISSLFNIHLSLYHSLKLSIFNF
ncbi:unnamed protein product [Brassica oleracea]